jgi:hypothetical protein
MQRLAGGLADGVLLNYLPASHVPWCVHQVRLGGAATVYANVHLGVGDRDAASAIGTWRRLNHVSTCSPTWLSMRMRRASPEQGSPMRSPKSKLRMQRAIVPPRSPPSQTGCSTLSRSLATKSSSPPQSIHTARPVLMSQWSSQLLGRNRRQPHQCARVNASDGDHDLVSRADLEPIASGSTSGREDRWSTFGAPPSYADTQSEQALRSERAGSV